MRETAVKRVYGEAASTLRSLPEDTGDSPSIALASQVQLGRPKHVRRLSLAELEVLAVRWEQAGARASKAGLAVVKRRAGSGRETPRLIVMTERAWCRLSGPADGGQTDANAPAPQRKRKKESVDERGGPDRPTVARPMPTLVSETVLALNQTSTTVLRPELIRALRQQTGCSQAGAYRAVKDAFAAGVISG